MFSSKGSSDQLIGSLTKKQISYFFIFTIVSLLFIYPKVIKAKELYSKFPVSDVKILKDIGDKAIDYGVDVDQHYIESVKLEPFVIAMEEETMTLEVKVTDPNITSIEILDGFCQQTKFNSGSRIEGLLLPNNNETITLYDDGTHGDKQSNDMIFTYDSIGFSKARKNSPYYQNIVRKTTWKTAGVAENWHRGREQKVLINFSNGSPKETTIHMDYSCGGINMDHIEIPVLTDLDSTARMSEHVLSITGFEKQTQFPYYYAQGPIYNHSEIAKKVYEYVKDDYDWIILQDVASGRTQQYWPIGRKDSGVYENQFDDSSTYGSQGKLRGIIYDESYWEPMVGVNKQFGRGDYSTLNHEISHTWISYFPDSLDISSSGHYNLIERKTSCFNGNGLYTVENIEFNETTNIATLNYFGDVAVSYDNEYCNDFELYLMGLIPKEQVLPIITLVNPRQFDYSSIPYTVTADGLRNVNIDEIIQEIGNRIPNSIDSPKSFKALMVVVHDRLLTDHEMALFEYRMQDYELERSENGKTFQHVTSDLATISTSVELQATQEPTQTFNNTDGLAGLWYNPNLPGEGFNIVNINGQMIIIYYGYANGKQIWMISEGINLTNIKKGEFSTPVELLTGDGGSFFIPIAPEDLVVWGTISVKFDSCTKGIFELDGVDGKKEFQLSLLAKNDGTNCTE